MVRWFVVLGIMCALAFVVPACRASDVGSPVDGTPTVLCLHPAFRLTPEDVASAMRCGQEAARRGKKLDYLLADYKRMPQWVRGKAGRVHESAVWCYSLGGLPVSLETYRAACEYTTPNIPEGVRTEGTSVSTLEFRVVLESAPRLAKYRWQRDRLADEEDVKVRKFVLSDDKGSNYEAEEGSASGSESSGIMTFSGVSVIPHTEDTTSRATATGSVYGSGGYAYGSATAYGTSTSTRYAYIPWSESHPYYQAKYSARFSLFGKDGRPRITQDVREITLRIVTENGEQDVTYTLPRISQLADIPKRFSSEEESMGFWMRLLRERYGLDVLYAASADDLIAFQRTLSGEEHRK